MDSNKRNTSVRVGLFVFVGISLFVGGILMIGNLHETFKRKVSVVALFDDVAGLQAGNNVWFSGVKIGVVSTIRFREDHKVGVTMRLDQKAQEFIRKDSRVKLSTDGLIGNRILIIYGGSTVAGQAEAGDTLAVEKTISQSDVLSVLQESNKNVLAITTNLRKISDDITHGKGTVGKLLTDTTLFDNLNAASVAISDVGTEGKKTLSVINNYLGSMAREGTFLNDLANDTIVFRQLREFTKRLNTMSVSTNKLISRLDSAATIETPAGILLYDSAEGAKVRSILKNVEESSSLLEEDLRAMQQSIFLRRYFKKKAAGKSP
jgi:phospholipid/cholesterol/gamma-HCH transport system substrate-binding protein